MEARLAHLLESYLAVAVPDDIDLWPTVSSRLGGRAPSPDNVKPATGTPVAHRAEFKSRFSLPLVAVVFVAAVVGLSAYLGLRSATVSDLASMPLETVVEVQAADDYMSSSFSEFSGCVLLSKGDEVLLSKCYGMADHVEEIPNTLQTVFPIGAITQHFTAAAIMKLEEEGLLDVKAPIGDYLPGYPGGENITVHDLLTHTSGIPNDLPANPMMESLSSPMSVDEVIELLRDEPLEFQPGERFSYSPSGYILLGFLIEEVSGVSYEGFLKDRLLEPAGMANTAYDRLGDPPPRRAKGHNYDLTPAQPFDTTSNHGAAAVASTIGDLYLWFRALTAGSLLTQDSVDKMFTPYIEKTIPSERFDYGYGLSIDMYSDPRYALLQGGLPGYHALIRTYREDDIVVIMLSNTLTSDAVVTSKIGRTSGVLATIALDY